MGITLKLGQIRITTKKFVGDVEDKMIMVMKYTGEQFIKDARKMKKSEGGFGDVTKNLRSSIGYFILKDGQILFENLRGKASGKSAARQFVESLPKKMGLQLIGIAGMNYASDVESKGKNVISMQAEAALIDLKDMLKDVTK